MKTNNNFGKMLRLYRRQSRDALNGGALSQERLADLLSEASGIIYSRAAISDWERSKGQIHKDNRYLLTCLLRVLHQSGGLGSLEEANQWLLVGNYRPLDTNEVQKISAEWGRPATASTNNHFFVPSLPTHPIVGRDELMARLHTQLLAGNNIALSAINGLPGVGKTTLATLLAHDPTIRTQFPDGVLWVGLGRDPDVFQLLGQWGEAIGITGQELTKLGAIRLRTNAIHNSIKQKQMLIVLDDVWENEAVRPFQLGGSNSIHVLTTRQPPIATQFAGDNMIQVSELNEQFAFELLQHLAPRVVAHEPASVRQLIRLSGGLPLALVLIGNHLRVRTATGPTRRIRAAVNELLSAENIFSLTRQQSLLNHDLHPSLPASTPISLPTIIQASDNALTSPANQALRKLALFPPKPNSFSEEAALFVIDATTEALDELCDHGLLEIQQQDRYTLHQTIHDYAQQHATENTHHERFVTFYQQLAADHAGNLSQLGDEIDNIVAALSIADSLNRPALLWGIVHATYAFFEERGDLSLIEHYLTSLAATNLPSKNLSEIYLRLGQIAFWQGEYDRATNTWQQGLDLARAVNATGTMLTLLSNLSTVAGQQQKTDDAARYLDEASILARTSRNWHELCRAQANRGRLEMMRDQYAEAQPFLSTALTIALENKITQLVTPLHNMLGMVARQIGSLDVALHHYQAGLELARQHRMTARILDQLLNLGELLNDLQRFDESIAYLEEGVTLARKLDKAWLEAHMLMDLGLAAIGKQQVALAQHYLREAYSKADSANDLRLQAQILAHWGHVDLLAGELASAEKRLTDCLNTVPKIGRSVHIEGMAQFGLAKLALATGKSADARSHADIALHIVEGKDMLLTTKLKTWLGILSET